MSEKASKRIDYLDYIKAIAIISIVVSHCGYYNYMITFSIPAFFMVSGFLINVKHTVEIPYYDTLKKTIKRLMYPYLTFSVIYVIYEFIKINIFHSKDAEISRYIIATVTFQGVNVLWFFPCLFIGDMLSIYILKRKNALLNIIYILITLTIVLISIYIFNFEHYSDDLVPVYRVLIKGLFASIYVILGYYVCELIRKIEIDNIAGLIVGTVLLIVYLSLHKYSCMDYNILDCNGNKYGGIVYFALSVVSFIAVLLICKSISSKIMGTVLSFIGRNSLIIMITHYELPFVSSGLKVSRLVFREPFLQTGLLVLFLVTTLYIAIIIFNKYLLWLIDFNKLKEVLKRSES